MTNRPNHPPDKGDQNDNDSNRNADASNSNASLFRAPDENQLYRPTMVHMKCRGMLHLSSKKHSLPSCDGIANGLETIKEYPPMKPHAVYQLFAHNKSFYHPADEEYADGDGNGNGNGNRRADPAPGFGANSPYPQRDTRKLKQQPPQLPLIVDDKWDEMKENVEMETSLDMKKFDSDQVRTDMKMYGTSSAYLLVLRPYTIINHDANANLDANKNSYPSETSHDENEKYRNSNTNVNTNINEEQTPQQHQQRPIPPKSIIYAITPSNEFGITKRKLHVRKKGYDYDGISCSSTTVKLGILEIHMASIGKEQIVEDHRSRKKSRSRNASDRKGSNNQDDADSDIEQIEDVGSIEDGVVPVRDASTDIDDETTIRLPSAIPIPTIPQTKEFLMKCNKASDKIQNQMKLNAKFLKDELGNDFVNRTFHASAKVTASCEKNLGRMKKTLLDVYKFISDISRD
jgi:hypothetical protein